VYPALAVLQTLKNKVAQAEASDGSDILLSNTRPEVSVRWVGGMGGMEADLVKRAGVPFEAIPAAGVHGVGVKALPGNVLQLARGYRQAGRVLREAQPDVLFFTGGYVAVPMALAGRKVPTVLYVPDIEPGLALKTLARFADCIAVTAEDSRSYFSPHARVVVTGYPTRQDLAAWNAESARQALGLSPDLPVLLVFGGSKGARSINRALQAALPGLLAEMQVVHISGELDWPEAQAARLTLPARLEQQSALADRYHAFPYLHAEMGAALKVADLVLSRAGASTLGEYPLLGLPAILVPYPHAWRYQMVNARYLVERGAALVIEDQDLPSQILSAVLNLIRNPARLDQMRRSMRSLARPEAAQSISQLIQDLAARRSQEGLAT